MTSPETNDSAKSPRLRRERRTFEAMVGMYCRRCHGAAGKDVCPECRELLDYAASRLGKCPFAASKPTCGRCPVHCYSRPMRERVIRVMRYSGPRLLWRHPVLALLHMADRMRKAPAKKVKGE